MPDQSNTYAAVKARQLDQHATYRVYGRPLDFETHPSRRWKPVFPCLCVHDSPDSPCSCPPWVWWLRSDMILAEGDAGRKDHEGNDLKYFDVLAESKIMVETVQSVSAGALKKLGSKLSPETIGGVADVEGGPAGLGTIEMGPIVAGIISGLIANAIYETLKGAKWGELTPEEKAQLCKRFGNPWWCGFV